MELKNYVLYVGEFDGKAVFKQWENDGRETDSMWKPVASYAFKEYGEPIDRFVFNFTCWYRAKIKVYDFDLIEQTFVMWMTTAEMLIMGDISESTEKGFKNAIKDGTLWSADYEITEENAMKQAEDFLNEIKTKEQ